MTTRSYALSQIMKIENQIKQLSSSLRYRRIEQNVRKLKNPQAHTIIHIQDPEKPDQNTIQIRKNSTQAKEYLKTYELQLYEYQILFNELHKRKNTLKSQLFG